MIEGVTRIRAQRVPRSGDTMVAADGVKTVQSDHDAAAMSPICVPSEVIWIVMGEVVAAEVQMLRVQSKASRRSITLDVTLDAVSPENGSKGTVKFMAAP
jgi:hypothetical protein